MMAPTSVMSIQIIMNTHEVHKNH